MCVLQSVALRPTGDTSTCAGRHCSGLDHVRSDLVPTDPARLASTHHLTAGGVYRRAPGAELNPRDL